MGVGWICDFCALILILFSMNDEWISTKELIAFLMAHPDDERECRLYLGGNVGSTHYWYWDSAKRCLMHTRDWPFCDMSVGEAVEWYGNCRWRVEGD